MEDDKFDKIVDMAMISIIVIFAAVLVSGGIWVAKAIWSGILSTP